MPAPETPDDKMAAAYALVFSGEDGQLVLSHLCSTFHVFTSSHAPGDPHETAFREGNRDVCLFLMRMADGGNRQFGTLKRRASAVEQFYGDRA